MKRNESVEALLGRWYAGRTTEAGERRLRRAMRRRPSAAADPDALLFAGLAALAEERMPAAAPLPGPQRRTRRTRIWIAATAAAALVALGIFAGTQARRPYCYIDGVAIYDKEQALAATGWIKGLDALALSDRLLDQLIQQPENNPQP